MISRDQINELAKRFAIDEFTIIKEYLQIVFLSILYSTNESQKIYFKGGTAIRLLLKSSRFSEDLDFTAELTTKELDRITAETVKKMSLVVPGILIKRTQEADISYTAILSYLSEGAKYPLTIHLDFSLREKPETSVEDVLETDFPVAPQPVIRHMDWTEVLSEKIRAFLYRQKGRDIYDLWFMLSKGIPLDWEMVNRKTKFYEMKTSFADVLKRVNEFDDKKIKEDLGKFLPVHDRGLAVQLKSMLVKQLMTRQSFTIASSENVDYTKVPGHSFSGTDKFLEPEEMKTTKITEIKRQDENSLAVKLVATSGIEATAYIRARSRNGVRELDVIADNAETFKGLSYDEFINQKIDN
ncbi:MAG: nucleotidyl transferase AbiEii/AbiGii toxin family protein [Patescibacteria group bacterium]